MAYRALGLSLGVLAMAGCGPTYDSGGREQSTSGGATSTPHDGVSESSEGANSPGGESTTGGAPGSGSGHVALCEAGGDWDADDGLSGDNDCDDGAEDTGFGMGDDMPLSVFQVQQGAAARGARVAISNVVVTSPASPGEAMGGLEFFVQELEGGPYSGLRVQGFDPLLDGFAAPGDTIDLSGEIAQNGAYYMLLLDSVDNITKVGIAEPPAPPVLAAAELSTQQAAARQYEGVVVQVRRATVTDAQPCLGEFTLDDAVRVDDRFVPNALDMPVAGQVIAQVQGVLVFADDEYELAPTLPAR